MEYEYVTKRMELTIYSLHLIDVQRFTQTEAYILPYGIHASHMPLIAFQSHPNSVMWRCQPGPEAVSVTAVELDTSRPRNSLRLRRGRRVAQSIHLERALTLSTERREDVLLLFLAQRLSLPGEEMQEKHQRRIQTAVGH